MNKFPITGTFIDEITYDIPSSNWSFEDWAKDLDNMKEVGMDTLVFIRGGLKDNTIYPSKIFKTLKEEDFLGFILDEAGKRDMSVYVGLYISNLDWYDGDYLGEIKLNKLFLDEVLSLYGDKKAFTGFYIPHETSHNVHNIKEIMNYLPKLCKEKAPDKKVLISPFFESKVVREVGYFSPERVFTEWDCILEQGGKYIDACAFQDGTAPLEQFGEYFMKAKEVCDKYGISLWANVETFERDVRKMYYPIPFELLRRKIELAKPYVEKSITFEFSHFLSPQSIYPSARNLNNLYKKYYGDK